MAELKSKPRVLVAEDVRAISALIAHMLQSRGYEVEIAGDGEECLALIAACRPDLVIHAVGPFQAQDYRVAGAFKIASAGTSITLSPDFPQELEVRIFVAPSEEAWKAVDEVVQERSSACKKTLEKIDIKQILGNILGKGFNVKIPQKLIKPVRLPAGIKQSLEIQGMKVALEVKPTGLLVASDRLWYGADIKLETAKPKAP